MRITIDIDGVSATKDTAPAQTAATPAQVTVEAPAAVLAEAAAIGAINAGPAPDFAQSSSVPHAVSAPETMLSAGPAPTT